MLALGDIRNSDFQIGAGELLKFNTCDVVCNKFSTKSR